MTVECINFTKIQIVGAHQPLQPHLSYEVPPNIPYMIPPQVFDRSGSQVFDPPTSELSQGSLTKTVTFKFYQFLNLNQKAHI